MFPPVDPPAGGQKHRAVLDRWLTGALDGEATGHRHPLLVALHGADRVRRRQVGLDWLLRVSHRLPDGHFHLDLRGSTDSPASTEEALAALLDSYGANGVADIASLEERAAWWRSITADRWIAVMLHDAASWRQIRPLLTAAPHSVTLITASEPLPGLLAHGARILHLDEEEETPDGHPLA